MAEKVCSVKDVPVGTGKCVKVGGKDLALFNVGGKLYAIDNKCSHMNGPLCQGKVDGTEVVCPWHGSKFDVTSGAAKGPPATKGVAKYKVEVKGTDVLITV